MEDVYYYKPKATNSTFCFLPFQCLIALIVVISIFNTISCSGLDLSGSDFHPSKMLSSSTHSLRAPKSSLSTSDSSVSLATSTDPLREDEVMYHMYRNGRTDGNYRKASTTFMVHLFNELQTGKAWAPGYRSKSKTITDTIRSFSGQTSHRTKKARQVISFHVPYLPWHERLRSAEIRFLRKPSIKAKARRFKIRVDLRKSGKLIKKFVLRERSLAQHAYDVFDVTRILLPWVNGYHGNVSLHVKVSKKLEKLSQLALRDKSLQSTSLVVLYLEDSHFLKNMYKSYTGDSTQNNYEQANSISPENSKRFRRSPPFSDPIFSDILSDSLDSSTVTETVTNKRFKRDSKMKKQRKRRNRKHRKWYRSGKREKCQLYDFDVDFSAIGWGEWIIHPKRFNARFCFGMCPSPIDSKFQPTNHAMLQTLMKMKKSNVAPSPCCVPTKLSPLSMLYFEYDEIVVRHHEDMIATECGCR